MWLCVFVGVKERGRLEKKPFNTVQHLAHLCLIIGIVQKSTKKSSWNNSDAFVVDFSTIYFSMKNIFYSLCVFVTAF